MANNNSDYSTKHISSKLVADFTQALQDLDWGSLEIYVSDSEVTQITKRQIKKTNSNRTKDPKTQLTQA